jgi:hypothetical protein
MAWDSHPLYIPKLKRTSFKEKRILKVTETVSQRCIPQRRRPPLVQMNGRGDFLPFVQLSLPSNIYIHTLKLTTHPCRRRGGNILTLDTNITPIRDRFTNLLQNWPPDAPRILMTEATTGLPPAL